MDKTSLENYQVEDFISDESFINYYFKSNKDDLLFWEEWLVKHEDKKALLKKAKETIGALSFNISEKEYKEELKKVTASIDERNRHSRFFKLSDSNKLLPSNQKRKKIIRYILPLLLIFIAGGYWLVQSSRNRSENVIETVNNSSMPLILTLSDSTIVSLAPHSYLHYPLHFNGKERNVYLHGNAQFSVKRNVAHPFKVHAENIVATVLGTVFNIKSSSDSAIVVELLKGKLNVEIMNTKMEPEQSVLLAPNERAVYVRNNKHLYKNLITPENHIYFRQNNFEEIAAQLKSVFGITLINESNKKSWRFTGEFKNTTAKNIIESICLIKKLSFIPKGDTIFIK